jgi:hypothetical protein
MEVEEINIVVDIYGDKNLVVDMGANYVPPFNEGHLVALNTYGQIYFSFGLENKGSSSIQITGATINDRDFGYADESVHPKGPKTISPGKIRTVSWLWPEKPTNNMRFTIEVKSSGGES